MTKEQCVVLVDEMDHVMGVSEKMEAHRRGDLHRAVSVLLFNSRGEWLLQQRAASKYHSPTLWSNSCCTHPYYGESYAEAAHRRLYEEMGLEDVSLRDAYHFIYRAALDQEMIEHELDHVFVGVSDELPVCDPAEVMDYRYMSSAALLKDIVHYPAYYSVWFRAIVDHLVSEQLLEPTLGLKL